MANHKMDSHVIDDITHYIAYLPQVPPGDVFFDDEADHRCPICIDTYYSAPLEHATKLPCGHVMGSKCLKKWLESVVDATGAGATCPCCRKLLGENMRHWRVQENRRLRSSKDYALFLILRNEGADFPDPLDINNCANRILDWRQDRALFLELCDREAFQDHDPEISGMTHLEIYEKLRDRAAHFCINCELWHDNNRDRDTLAIHANGSISVGSSGYNPTPEIQPREASLPDPLGSSPTSEASFVVSSEPQQGTHDPDAGVDLPSIFLRRIRSSGIGGDPQCPNRRQVRLGTPDFEGYEEGDEIDNFDEYDSDEFVSREREVIRPERERDWVRETDTHWEDDTGILEAIDREETLREAQNNRPVRSEDIAVVSVEVPVHVREWDDYEDDGLNDEEAFDDEEGAMGDEYVDDEHMDDDFVDEELVDEEDLP